MKEIKRLNFIFKIIRVLIYPIVKIKFNYHYDSIKNIDGPYIIVCNHNTDWDPVFIGISSKEFSYFVATEKIMRMGLLSKIVKFCFNPIIHYKGKMGITTVKEMLKHLKDGENVGIFPEGNRSFNGETCNFNSSICKVIKKSGAKLITYQLKGGYLSQPRWATTFRKGKVVGKFVNVYNPEVLSQLDESEINEIIKRDLYVNAYDDQKINPIPYKGKNLALGLESAIFICPKCKNINTLHSTNEYLLCQCGYKEKYDLFGYVGNKSVLDLDKLQRKTLSNFYNSNEIIFGDFVSVEEIDENHSVSNSYNSTISAMNDRLFLGDKVLMYSDIGMAIHSRNTLIIHTENDHFEIKGEIGFNALKYLYLYEKI